MKFQWILNALLCIGLLFCTTEVYAADTDARFLVELFEEEDVNLNIQSATALALPILWKRIVPSVFLEKANALPARTSLLRQYKPMKHGVKLVFNPNQVRSFLARHKIKMIPERPQWNLNVYALGISDSDQQLSQDLRDYSHAISDELGFALGARGQRLQLIFAPVFDVYGELLVHVDVQGAFSSELLSQTEVKIKDFVVIQTQDFLNQILREIRDAYALGTLVFENESTEMLLTIESEQSLATQVMMEQALRKHPAVTHVVPTQLQKEKRQYRIQLRDGDDSWIVNWFADFYGLQAARQPAGSVDDWLVR